MITVARNVVKVITFATVVACSAASFTAPALSSTPAAAADAFQKPTDAATVWLGLIDSGKYDQSWRDASALFKDHVTQAQWSAEAKAAREPLGQIDSRSVQGIRFAASLPGAPDGKYTIIQFRSRFAFKQSAIETVTMVMENGLWKGAGYFIK